MEFRQLQHFMLVAQELSFAKASKQAYITQQALSKSVIALEKELGVQLFKRHPHGVSLTSYGQVLLRNTNQIFAQINNMENDIRNVKLKKSNTIRIAITGGVENSFSIEKFIAFQDSYPQYEVSTVTSNDVAIEKWLCSEQIELALLGARGDSAKLDFIPLFESATMLAVHKSNPLCRKTSVKLEDLYNEVFISGSTEYYAINRLFLICKFLGFVPTVKHITENILFIAQLVASNQGVFLCPDSSIRYFDHPDICLLPFEDDPKIFSVYLATPKNQPLSEGAELLKEFILRKT
jgi:DNA-binding transcriptional LysR family regulator